MSPIDSILDGLRLESSVFCRMTLSGGWGFAKDALSGAPFHLMLSGHAWLLKDGVDEALPLHPGDIVVLPRGEPHRLLSSPDADAVPFKQVVSSMGLAPWTPAHVTSPCTCGSVPAMRPPRSSRASSPSGNIAGIR